MPNKKTFLLVKALESANAIQKKNMLQLLDESGPDKVQRMLSLFKDLRRRPCSRSRTTAYTSDQALVDLEADAGGCGKKGAVERIGIWIC